MSEFKYLDQLKQQTNTLPATPSGQGNYAFSKTSPMPNDSVEISTKDDKCGTSCMLNVAGMLAVAAAAVGGITHGGIKIYENYFQKLASGIKKGEINDALFSFIKRVDPKGKIFSNRQDILVINENLTDENFLILKRLSKMKEARSYWFIGSESRLKNRFTAQEMTKLLKSTNEHNIGYLTQLAEIKTVEYGLEKFLDTGQIIKVLEKINVENEEVASQLIRKTEAKTVTELANCLAGINKDNLDIYKLVLSTRINAGVTELSYSEISSMAKLIEDTKKPRIVEFLLNQKHKDGTGTYRHEVEDLSRYVRDLKEEDIEVYKKVYNIKALDGISDDNMLLILKNANDENYTIIESLMQKEYGDEGSKSMLFKDYKSIGNILSLTNKENIPIVSRMIELCNSRYIFPHDYSGCYNADEYFVSALQKLNSNPQKLANIKGMLAMETAEGGKPLKFDDLIKAIEK